MNDDEPKYFTKFKKELYEKLDAHEEQIAHVSEQVTMLDIDVKKIEEKLDRPVFA